MSKLIQMLAIFVIGYSAGGLVMIEAMRGECQREVAEWQETVSILYQYVLALEEKCGIVDVEEEESTDLVEL